MNPVNRQALEYDMVVVNYQSTDLLLELLEDVQGLDHPPAAVYVVDNGSSDDPGRIKRQFPQVKLTLSPLNLGFGRGANLGWRQGKSPLVLFVNPDSRLLQDDYSPMLEYLASHPWVGAVGPKILDSDGKVQGSARGFHSFWTIFAGRRGPLTRLLPNSPMVRRDVPILHSDGKSPMRVDWLSGACLLVRRRYLRMVHGFDDRFFMYFEDTDLCRELMKLGLESHYYPACAIAHRVGGSSPGKPLCTRYWFHQSCFRYLAKYHLPRNDFCHLGAAVLIGMRFGLLAGLHGLSRILNRIKGQTA